MGKIVSSARPLLQYKWGDNCDAFVLADTRDLCVKLEQMPPGTQEQFHQHDTTRQFFYVLEGEALFDVDTEEVKVSMREGIMIEPGLKHRVRNPGPGTLKFILCSQPNMPEDRKNLED